MNLPNKISLARIGLAFVLMLFLFLPFQGAKSLALLVFIAACLSDLVDGRIARRYNQVTNFGKLIDPIADKILILSAFLAFVELKIIAGWLVVLIICRELLVTGLRLLAATRGKVLASTRGGKHKVVSQMMAIIAILGYLALKEDRFWGLSQFINRRLAWFEPGIFLLMIVTVVLTLISGATFFWKNRRLLVNNRASQKCRP